MTPSKTDIVLRAYLWISSVLCSPPTRMTNSRVAMTVFALATSIILSQNTFAAPSVLADISPTHSLVSMVMGDVGKPTLLVSSASSPHDFALRPSDATKITNADLIFYTSATLTPWLGKALQSLAQETPAIELIATSGTHLLPLRNDHLFSHTEHEGHAEHSASVYDPHAWLDPANAIVWLHHIASQLAKMDSLNAPKYRQNAEQASLKIQTMIVDVTAELDDLQTVPYVVFHDSYQYFENRFNLQPKASISLGDGSQPGISQIRTLQAVIKSTQANCVFSEPQYSDRLVNTVISGMDIKTRRLDPLGFELEPGENLYIGLVYNLSSNLLRCLSVN